MKGKFISRARFCIPTLQDQIDVGLNGFAIELLAESFERRLAQDHHFGDGVCVIAYGKNNRPVYITISSQEPVPDETPEDAETSHQDADLAEIRAQARRGGAFIV